ncbi:MAG: hypothetical protein AB3N17_14820 [Tateyamaria sp.]
MKLCVIGNSHAGMIVHAARAGAADGFDLTYMARQGRGPEGIRLRGNTLRAMRPETRRALARLNMPDRVKIDDFDAFVVVAMTATVFSVAPLLGEHSVFTWPSMRRVIADSPDNETALLERPFLSEPALIAALVHAMEDNIAHSVVQKIRRVSDVPILMIAQPHPSETVMQAKSRQSGIKSLVRKGDGAEAARILDAAHARCFGAFKDVTRLAQPPETIVQGCLTAAEFTRGAGRLSVDGTQPEDDILHANAAYGAKVFEQIRATLQAGKSE